MALFIEVAGRIDATRQSEVTGLCLEARAYFPAIGAFDVGGDIGAVRCGDPLVVRLPITGDASAREQASEAAGASGPSPLKEVPSTLPASSSDGAGEQR